MRPPIVCPFPAASASQEPAEAGPRATAGTGVRPSPPSARPDLRPKSERRIARTLRLAAHGWWLAPLVAVAVKRPWWALGLAVLCGALECARGSYEVKRQARRRVRYGGEDARRLADRIRDGWSTATDAAGLSYVSWRPAFFAWEGADSLAAKLDRAQHVWRRLGDRQWPPQLDAIEPHPLGLVLTVVLSHGQTVNDFAQAAARLATQLRAIRVDVHGGPAPDEVQLVVVIRRPLLDPIPLPPSRPYLGRGVVELGIREDGQPWSLSFQSCSGVLVAGMPGAGKSGTLRALLAGLVGAPRTEVAGIDLKAGVELGPWEPAMLTLATSLAEAVAVLEEGVDLLDRRFHLMRAAHVVDVTELHHSVEHPMRVIVVDEAADLFAAPPGDRAAKELTDRAVAAAVTIARKGRAGSVRIVLATQKPDATTIPTVLRDQLGPRIAHRTPTRQHAETILGGLVDLTQAPWQIPPNLPGVALVAGSEPEPLLARAYQVTSEDVRRIVKQATREQADE
ncbi:MAG: cell division FtsK/SpoIIIE [Solirubrobacterales bacterium]|nr:cell division FtsK/SpoIIIE [Solirubrobacterales bacterium]